MKPQIPPLGVARRCSCVVVRAALLIPFALAANTGCQAITAVDNDWISACVSPLVLCESSQPACVDLSVDPKNCGECGAQCSANQACSAGKCVGRCAVTTTTCNATCTFLETDPLNCGQCFHACASNEGCEQGICKLNCPLSSTNCNGTCAALFHDPNNCGTCFHSCASSGGSFIEQCVGGVCLPLDAGVANDAGPDTGAADTGVADAPGD